MTEGSNQGPQPAPRGCGWGCLLVLAAVVVAGLWGFNWLFYSPRHEVATSLSDYRDVCAGRPIPGAPAYTPGPGPHPMAVFENDSSGTAVLEGADGLFNPRAFASVELVACSDRVDEGPVVSSCSFDKGTVAQMYASEVEITVYEARTAEQVGEPVTVTGQKTECPHFITYKGKPELYTKPTSQQFVQVLTPYLTR